MLEPTSGNTYAWWGGGSGTNPYSKPIKAFVSPADETHVAGVITRHGWGGASYAANALLLAASDATGVMQNWDGGAHLGTIKDGASQTVAFAEKIADCNSTFGSNAGNGSNLWGVQWGPWWPMLFCNACNMNQPGGISYLATDPLILPQQRPDQTDCDSRRASSPHNGAILVSMADGTVRGVKFSVTQLSWWRAFKPDDRGALGEDF